MYGDCATDEPLVMAEELQRDATFAPGEHHVYQSSV